MPISSDGDANSEDCDCDWVHSLCALSATEVVAEEHGDAVSLDLSATLSVCAQFKCHICHRAGASMHCAAADCALSFHFPCVVSAPSLLRGDWHYDALPFFCNFHQPLHSQTAAANRKAPLLKRGDQRRIVLTEVEGRAEL